MWVWSEEEWKSLTRTVIVDISKAVPLGEGRTSSEALTDIIQLAIKQVTVTSHDGEPVPRML